LKKPIFVKIIIKIMTERLKAFLVKLSSDAAAKEAFRREPLKALKAAKLSNKDTLTVLSGDLPGNSGLKPSLHIQVQISVVIKNK
jgi:hypothetical protein